MNDIDNLRQAMGTLPSITPKKSYRLIRGLESLKVIMYDFPKNPYKIICEAATATWGDDEYKEKWPQLLPENRYRVVLAALTGNTLPQSLEAVQFSFRVNGVTRACFDQHARARVGTTFFSIGSRDNCKLDSRLILYTKLYDKMEQDPELKKRIVTHFKEMKNIYEMLVANKSSWQIARAVLPMCYNHSYCFSQNLLALRNQCAKRMKFCEEEFIVGLHWMLREKIKSKFPLIANYLRPGCDYSKSCQYSKSYALSNAFGCLFKGCGRWPSKTEYSTFNESCSDIETIEQQLKIHIPRPNEWINYTENDYDKLSDKDKKLFESD